MKTIPIFLLCLYLFTPTFGQDAKENIEKELSFSSSSADNLLTIQNINGPVEVIGYSGNTIQVEATKTISGKNAQLISKGKEEVQLKFAEKGDKVFVYVETLHNKFDLEKGKYKDQNYEKGGYKSPGYRHHIEIKLKVPRNSNLVLRTMNDGDVLVENVQAKKLKVSNLNGAIRLDNVAGETHVNALNKDIHISYAENPTANSTYHSLNGDIHINLKEDLDADVSFKTLNGDFYTNLEGVTLTPKVSQSEGKGKNGVRYKINKEELFRIGKGGVKMDFDLLNGDVMLKKISS